MDPIHETITALVNEERELRARGDHSDEQLARMRRIEEQLDQCWDLLRRRDALREAGVDPDTAQPRSINEVEGYLQ
jgi:hypothetical protein